MGQSQGDQASPGNLPGSAGGGGARPDLITQGAHQYVSDAPLGAACFVGL